VNHHQKQQGTKISYKQNIAQRNWIAPTHKMLDTNLCQFPSCGAGCPKDGNSKPKKRLPWNFANEKMRLFGLSHDSTGFNKVTIP
jgi:hypothetical protein